MSEAAAAAPIALPFNADSTADDVIRDIRLDGKVAIVTGANSGIGKETVRVLAKAGARVIVACRNVEEGKKVVAEFSEQIPEAKERLEVMHLDLSKFSSVRQFAADFNSKKILLHILILNAGIMALPEKQLDESGFESQFSTNHLGHFLLTNLLMGPMKAVGNARIVVVSSGAHRYGGLDLNDVNFEKRAYEKWLAYGQSKTSNVLFARELNKRLSQEGFKIRANSLHPGAIATNLGRHLGEEDKKMLASRGFKWKTIPQGAATQVLLATAPELENVGGLYFSDCQVGELLHPLAKDDELAKGLWELSENAVSESTGSKL